MSICKSLTTSTKNGDIDSTRYPSEIHTTGFSQTLNQRSSTQLFEQIQPPNIEHELNVAKSIIQQGSFITGDNLFDHLAEIIKLVIKERPENIVDYFEELSLNIREQKLRIPENFPWNHFEPVDVEKAKSFMKIMNLPDLPNDDEYDVCKENTPSQVGKLPKVPQQRINTVEKLLQRKLSLNENVQRLHLYWALCGFGISTDEVSKLSYALQKVQFHQIIQHARFWGIIYGLKKSYYIVEALLTQSEIDIRFDKMREEVIEKISIFQDRKIQGVNKEQNVSLTPGAQWQNHSEGDVAKMKHECAPIPNSKSDVLFDTPPEPIGTGLNRRTYFVVNSLNDEWIELPIVYPQQIQISRKIKKFLTGELDADVASYPTFSGTEKHYLRTIIARITSGTYVAPNDYYRRLTKTEIMEIYGESTKATEEEIDESDGEEEDEDLDNDAIVTENEKYQPNPQKLTFSKSWVHVRPNILEQGRIAYFDEKKALEALEKGSFINGRNMEEQIEETDIEEGEDFFEADDSTMHESGPSLFTTCHKDKNEENIKNWTIRNSSTHNKINQLTIMRSNLWPGAYSFTFEKYSDSIYFGWGLKYTARNVSIAQLPPIQADYDTKGLDEVPDPTVEMEQAWRLFHEKKQIEENYEEEVEEEEEESC